MRNLFALVGFVVVVFVGAGWYFQWYSFSSKSGLDGRSQFQLDVDTRKMAADAKALGERVGSAVQPAPATPVTAQTPPGFVGPPAPNDVRPVAPVNPGAPGGFGVDIQVPPPYRR